MAPSLSDSDSSDDGDDIPIGEGVDAESHHDAAPEYDVQEVPVIAYEGATTKCYPMDFFTSLGKVPDRYEDLVQRWRYRESRPLDARLILMDVTAFDENVMKKEMILMRQSLFQFADQVYTSSFKEVATNSGLSHSYGQRIVRDNDLKSAVLQLERSWENEVLVYKIFHHRMRTDKHWHATIVDNWAASNHIHLLPPRDKLMVKAAGKRVRNATYNRQGFGTICLEARKAVLQRYMRPLMTKSGWNIATTNKERQSKRVYTRKIVTIEHKQQSYYVVEDAKSVSFDRVGAILVLCGIFLISGLFSLPLHRHHQDLPMTLWRATLF